MTDSKTSPTEIDGEPLESVKCGSAIIQRVEDPDHVEFHGSDFNTSKTGEIAAMGNSGHFHGSDINTAKRK